MGATTGYQLERCDQELPKVLSLAHEPRWKSDCNKVFGTSLMQMESGKFQTRRLSVMRESGSHATAQPLAMFPEEWKDTLRFAELSGLRP